MRKCRRGELCEDYPAHSSFKTSCQEEQMGMAEEMDMGSCCPHGVGQCNCSDSTEP